MIEEEDVGICATNIRILQYLRVILQLRVDIADERADAWAHSALVRKGVRWKPECLHQPLKH
jgi:hypothetical protein